MQAAAICGLAAEAKIARRAGLTAVACGGDAARTAAAAERLLRDGAAGLVSFGIAGGLDPALAAGTLLLPETVIDATGRRWSVDTAWRGAVLATLAAAGVAVRAGDLLGAAQAVETVAAKSALFRATGAVAVDLETHLVAAAASLASRPFLVLRAIADPAGRSLPPAAAKGLDEQGRPALGAVLVSLARDPRQLPGLLRVAGDTRRALAALRNIGSLPPFKG